MPHVIVLYKPDESIGGARVSHQGMKKLYTLREHEDSGFIAAHANETLEAHAPEYIRRYGRICSDQWWRLYDAGRISRTILCGEIIHVGHIKDCFGEDCSVVQIQTDRGLVEYDLEDCWTDQDVQPGRRIQIERVKTVVQTSTGPIITQIDVSISVEQRDQHMAAGR